MTAVIQVLAIHKIVLDRLPTGRLHLSDASPFLGRHGFDADAGHGIAAAVIAIQLRVEFVSIGIQIIRSKPGFIVVDNNIGFSGKRRDCILSSRLRLLRSIQDYAASQLHDSKQAQQHTKHLFHRSYTSCVIKS